MQCHKQVAIHGDGLDLAAEVNAAFVVSSGEPGTARRVESIGGVQLIQSSGDRRRTVERGEQEVSDGREQQR